MFFKVYNNEKGFKCNVPGYQFHVLERIKDECNLLNII